MKTKSHINIINDTVAQMEDIAHPKNRWYYSSHKHNILKIPQSEDIAHPNYRIYYTSHKWKELHIPQMEDIVHPHTEDIAHSTNR